MILSFLFHGLFPSKSAIDPTRLLPQQEITIDEFERFILFFLKKGCEFVSDAEVLSGSGSDSGREKMQIVVTFDDGYANHLLALPILERYQVPALFYIPVKALKDRESFWWDVVQRHELSKKNIKKIHDLLLKKPYEFARCLVENRYGPSAFDVNESDDLTRPMNEAEIRRLKGHPMCHIGHHAVTHAWLPALSAPAVMREIQEAEVFWKTQYEIEPVSLAYPYGASDHRVQQLVKKSGYRLAFGVQKGFLACDERSEEAFLNVPRWTLWGDHNMEAQCARIWHYANHIRRWNMRNFISQKIATLKNMRKEKA